MKKNSTKGYVILGILFVVVSVIAFAVPLQKTAAFWITYAFTAIAILAQIVIWNVALGREDTLKSKFLGLPVLHLGTLYLIVQLAAFAVYLFIPVLPVWSAVVVCVALGGVFSVCMISADVGRNEIERVEDKIQKKAFYIRALQADVELLANVESDAKVKAELLRLAEKIRYSDPMSHEQVAELEAQIAEKVSDLKAAANKGEIITEIHLLLDERNRKIKMCKGDNA